MITMSDDLISRQSAIDALCSECQGRCVPCDNYPCGEVKAIEVLPSAQPEIIRCKDCENWDMTWQNDWAKNYHYCPLIDGTRNGDWYCADAERKTDGRD